MFTAENGAALDPESVSRYWRQAVKKAMLPPIRLHDLRHTHATLALQAGVHPKVVSERLGHATVSITLDTYSHAIPAMQEEAAALIAGLVFLLRTPSSQLPDIRRDQTAPSPYRRDSSGGADPSTVFAATIPAPSTSLGLLPTIARAFSYEGQPIVLNDGPIAKSKSLSPVSQNTG